MRVGSLVCLLGLCLADPRPAQAQARPGAWEISGGGAFAGGYSLGEQTAELTSNTGPRGTPSEFFVTESTVEPVLGLRARIGYFVSSALLVEGGLRFTRPVYEVQISGDTEGAADVTAVETLTQYVFDASVAWHFGRAGGGRAVPFVYGGAGYLRELHEDDALVEDGVEFHTGAGVKFWLGARRRAGIRGDVGISIRDGGFDFEEKRRVVPEAGGSFVWVF
jgi:hypothetical protein